jgi:hypothetical protein
MAEPMQIPKAGSVPRALSDSSEIGATHALGMRICAPQAGQMSAERLPSRDFPIGLAAPGFEPFHEDEIAGVTA